MQAIRVVAVVMLPLFAVPSAAEEQRPAFPVPRLAPYPDRGTDARLAEYRALQQTLEDERQELHALWRSSANRERHKLEAKARDLLERSLVELSAPWIGTPWDFYGTSEEPGRGQIACGYFVTTLLRDTGLRIERARLAQQASEYIVKTLSPAARTWRFRTGNIDTVLDTIAAQPERWFVIGLDLHVGLLVRLDGGQIRFCHSSYLEPVAAVCEDARTAAAMQSRYHVVGALFTPELVRRWLTAERVASVTPR